MVESIQFTTGPSTLPDVGELAYNGCTFSPLFETKLSGKAVKDNANRTTKYMEYTLSADGYVTLPAGDQDIDPTMRRLKRLLTAQAGRLVYRGRGFDLVVNQGGAKGPVGLSDVAWGPVPEVLEFQPLGAGRSAKVQWRVTVRIPEIARVSPGILQLNYETGVSYGEDGYSTLSIRGTLEIPLTRSTQGDRTVRQTADTFRRLLEPRILKGIDLRKFRLTRREFNVSRDKRTLDWEVTAEERPYMDPPVDCTIARGTYNVRPVKAGMGLANWLCTLRATYTVRRGAPKRMAWVAFLALLRLRMRLSSRGKLSAMGLGDIDKPNAPEVKPKPGFFRRLLNFGSDPFGFGGFEDPFGSLDSGNYVDSILKGAFGGATDPNARKVWLIDFSFDEGLYLDSKTITFSATWRLNTDFSHILLASGLWRKVEEEDRDGNNLWAASVRKISGVQSWLPNELDPSLDVVVDFGGPDNL